MNEAAERLLQRSRAVLHATSLWDAVPGMRGGVFEASYRSAVASGEPVTFEAAHPGTGHGSFEVRAWPGPGGVAVYLLDVTDRRRAQDTARQVVERAALLAEVRAELGIAQDTESALARLARLVVPTLADGCIVTVVDREGRVHDIGSWHADPDRRPLMEQYAQVRLDTLPSASPVARALDAGTPVTESVAAVRDLMVPGPARDLLERLGPSSATVLRLTADERTVGVLTLYQDAGRTVPAEDLATARQVASAAARAIARVHRQSQQALLAEALQRSLLTEPPDLGSTAAEPVVVVEPGSTLFLYTDGLIERRDRTIDAGMDRLAGLLRTLAGGPLEEMCDAVLARMLPATPQDDVALVAVRLSADPG